MAKSKHASGVFERYEGDVYSFTSGKTGKRLGVKEKEIGPHQVRLPITKTPYKEPLSPYHKMAIKLFGGVAKKYVKDKEEIPLELTLAKAHIKLSVEEFLAFAWLTMLLGVTATVVAGIVLILLSSISIYLLLGGIILLIAGPIGVILFVWTIPSRKAKARGKDIDKKMADAMTFVSTLASANVNIDVIFKELAKQEMYGEIQEEAKWIVRDVELFGKDILTAIREGAVRSPSVKFQDFLQGVVTTTLSGGHLKPYFVLKAEQYSREEKIERKAAMEVLGLMAEMFVVVGVAMPLFLIVMISLMSMVGTGGTMSLMFLRLLVYGMIPGLQFAFGIIIQSMSEGLQQ